MQPSSTVSAQRLQSFSYNPAPGFGPSSIKYILKLYKRQPVSERHDSTGRQPQTHTLTHFTAQSHHFAATTKQNKKKNFRFSTYSIFKDYQSVWLCEYERNRDKDKQEVKNST